MEFSPFNSIVKRCLQGMEMEAKGSPEEANKLFRQGWEEAANEFEKFLAAYYVARHQPTVSDHLHWLTIALEHALKADNEATKSALPTLYSQIAACYDNLEDVANAKKNHELSALYGAAPSDKGPFYHGTKADLQLGDLLVAGGVSNYQSQLVMNHIYFTALVSGAGLAAALAKGDGLREALHQARDADLVHHLGNLTCARGADQAANAGVSRHDRFGCGIIDGVTAAHDGKLAIFRPGLPTGDRRVDTVKTPAFPFLEQLSRNPRRNGRVIDKQCALRHGAEGAVLTQRHGRKILVIADTADNDLCLVRRLRGRHRLARLQAQQMADAGHSRVTVLLGVVAEQFVCDQCSVRALADNVGEGAAAVDPELPLRCGSRGGRGRRCVFVHCVGALGRAGDRTGRDGG